MCLEKKFHQNINFHNNYAGSVVWRHMNTEQCGDLCCYINLTCFFHICLTHMNHSKFDLFFLKLYNLNGWKICM